jgi:hypothetical protein
VERENIFINHAGRARFGCAAITNRALSPFEAIRLRIMDMTNESFLRPNAWKRI